MAFTISILRERGLNYKFSITPQTDPESSPLWEFGDGITIQSPNPAHTYAELGTYKVKATLEDVIQEVELVIPTRTKSLVEIFEVSLGYIPSVLTLVFDLKKENLKEKWLLYLQPVVNHTIPEDKYYLELYYEALEIQLAGELVAHDFLLSEITKNIVGAITSSSGSIQDGEDEGDVKKIITGPTQAEFFSDAESAAKITKALSDLNKPGGVMDGLKTSICQLASRLEIYLPMCGLPQSKNLPFEVVRRDRPPHYHV